MRQHVDIARFLAGFTLIVTYIDAASALARKAQGGGRKKLMDDPLTCETCNGNCDDPHTTSETCPPQFSESCAAVYNRNGDVLAKGCARNKTRGCDHYLSAFFQFGHLVSDESGDAFDAFIACYCDKADECNRELTSYVESSSALTSVRQRSSPPSTSTSGRALPSQQSSFAHRLSSSSASTTVLVCASCLSSFWLCQSHTYLLGIVFAFFKCLPTRSS